MPTPSNMVRLSHALLLPALLLGNLGCQPAPTAAPTTAAPAASATPAPPTITPAPTATALPTAYPTEFPALPAAPSNPLGAQGPRGTDGLPWWNDAVFYEVFVRSFADSDGDGIGDINGLTSKLDYLNDGDPATTTDLGITGLWLMPIMPSPSYHGYDVTDYYDVNPQYGTMEDFKRFLAEAHKRGIRVSIDMVLNHTSSRHPWFEASTDRTSPFHNWYMWQDQAPRGVPGWQYGSGSQYYYALFSNAMPDLNYANPAVRAEMKKVARFWLLDVGVDGFRLDAAKHIFEEGAKNENLPATHDWWAEYGQYVRGTKPGAFTVGEVWSNTDTVASYLQGDQLDLAFAFDLAGDMVYTAGTGTQRYAANTINRTNTLIPRQQYASFLTNHDQNRVMGTLKGNQEDAKIAAMLLLTTPGVPFIYYGEELGQLGEKPDENIRLPMQWSAAENAGFTTAKPWRAPYGDYKTKNVEAQSADPNSLLSFYRSLIHLRNDHQALRVGTYVPVATPAQGLNSFLRVSNGEAVLVLINAGHTPVQDWFLRAYETALPAGNYTLTPLFGSDVATLTLTVDAEGKIDTPMAMPIPVGGRMVFQLNPAK